MDGIKQHATGTEVMELSRETAVVVTVRRTSAGLLARMWWSRF